jgi:putative Ca2+/H+ antiporter (TMEM165/GDT1 family)
VMPFLGAVAIAFGAVFVAELGDKTQLLVLAFATRHSWRPVVAGLVGAALLIQGVSVAIGATVGAVLPGQVVAIVAGIAFLVVAGWILRGEADDDVEAVDQAPVRRGAVGVALMVASAFLAAELGDKSMLATFAVAAQQAPLPTWIGSVGGEVLANLLAVIVGRQVGMRLSPRAVRFVSAALFGLAGAALVIAALVGGGG